MNRRPGIRYTQDQKMLMWDRYQKVDSIRQIAVLFDRYHSSISGIFAKIGGGRPAARKRSSLALTPAELRRFPVA